MGRKIFVSYKYADGNVYPVPYISDYQPKVRDYVTWLEKKFTDRTEHIYKGEHDSEDLSDKSDEYIWMKLKDKIYDSTITIVLISPNMKEAYKWDRSQWIPWEIAYSLRETQRGDRTSHSNAVLAVVLPDRNYQYNYFQSPLSYQRSDGQWSYGEDSIFSIIRKNQNNRFSYYSDFFSSKGIYPISVGEESYIPSVVWDDFIKQPMRYIDCAVQRKENIHMYDICKEV